MKILHVMPYVPVPPIFGGAMRVHHLLAQLLQRHEVSVIACGTTEEKLNMQRVFGHRLRNLYVVPKTWKHRFRRLGQLYAILSDHSYYSTFKQNRLMQEAIDRLLSKESVDIVLTEGPTSGAFRYDCDAVRILDAHNIEYDILRRMWLQAHSPVRRLYYRHEYKKFLREEIEICRRQDAIILTSPRDQEILRADVPGVPSCVVPNGVDSNYFHPSDNTPEPWSLVFTGMMGYVPNYDGMFYFLDEIFPRILKAIPQTKIYIVGNRPPKSLQRRASDSVIVTGYVGDVRPFVWRSSAYVVPLRMGGGTRLKVLEAMAMKKPVVTTSIGCEGIDVTDGTTVLIRNDPHQFADTVVMLLRSAKVRERLTRNAFELIRAKYEWSVIGEIADAFFHSIVAANSIRRRAAQQQSTKEKGLDSILTQFTMGENHERRDDSI